MTNTKKDKTFNTIYTTTKFGKFKGTWDNRISLDEYPDTKEYRALRTSIVQHGMNLSPIMVTPAYQIIEGHHRFLACKETSTPLQYMIVMDFGLDDAISLSETTSKWSNNDKVARGIKHKIALCSLVEAIAVKFPVYGANLSTTLLRVCDYLRWAYPDAKIPAHQTVLGHLVKGDGIKFLKDVEITKEMESDVLAYHTLLLAIADTTERNYDKEKDADFIIMKAYDKRLHQVVLDNYTQIISAMPEFLVEWNKICARKKYRGNKDIYLLMTSQTTSVMQEGLRKLLNKPVFLKK